MELKKRMKLDELNEKFRADLKKSKITKIDWDEYWGEDKDEKDSLTRKQKLEFDQYNEVTVGCISLTSSTLSFEKLKSNACDILDRYFKDDAYKRYCG